MADAESTYSAARVDQLLKCPVCLDRYTNPKILPCQHTFCLSPCLEGLISHGHRVIKCPECRAQHIVPYGGATSFPTNITIANFLDLQPQTNRSSQDEGSSQPASQSNKCRVCEQTALTSKCSHCDKMVCESCRRSHAGQMKVDIGRMIGQIRRSFPKISNNIADVEQRTEQIKQRVQTVKSEVKNTIERYIKQLRDRETQLASELETFLQGELRSVRMHQETLEVELASMASYCDSTESMLKRSDGTAPDEDLVTMKRQCTEYIEQIRNIENEPIPETRQVRFAFSGEALQEQIGAFGIVQTAGGQHRSAGSGRSDHHHDHSELSNPSHSAPPVSANNSRRGRWSDVTPVDITAILANNRSPSPDTVSYFGSNNERIVTDRLLQRPHADYTSSPRLASTYSPRNNNYLHRLDNEPEDPELLFQLAQESPRTEALMDDIVRYRESQQAIMRDMFDTTRTRNISTRYGQEARSGENMAALLGGRPAYRRHSPPQRYRGSSHGEYQNGRSRRPRERVAGLMGGGGGGPPARFSRSPERPLHVLDIPNQTDNPDSYNIQNRNANTDIQSRTLSPPVRESSTSVSGSNVISSSSQEAESASATVRARWAGRGATLDATTEPTVGRGVNRNHSPRTETVQNGSTAAESSRDTVTQRSLPPRPGEAFDIPVTPVNNRSQNRQLHSNRNTEQQNVSTATANQSTVDDQARTGDNIPNSNVQRQGNLHAEDNEVQQLNPQRGNDGGQLPSSPSQSKLNKQTGQTQNNTSSMTTSTSTHTVVIKAGSSSSSKASSLAQRLPMSTAMSNRTKVVPPGASQGTGEPVASTSAGPPPPDGPTRSRTFVCEDGGQNMDVPRVTDGAVGFSVDLGNNKQDNGSKKKKKKKSKK